MLWLWGPVALYCALIFGLSSVSDVPPLPGGISDKMAHALLYSGLGFLVARALTGGRRQHVSLWVAVATVAAVTAYGLTDETHQLLRSQPAVRSEGPGGGPRRRLHRHGGPVAVGYNQAGFPLRGSRWPSTICSWNATAAVATITVHRPRVLNALDSQTIDDLRRAALELKRDDEIRAVIVTGAGEKAFVAGADIDELARLGPDQAKAYALAGQHVFDLLENLGKPVIAAVNGFALGGGCELAMACTFRLAADTARLGQPEIKLGLMPGFAGTQRLPRLVGKGRALDLLLTGRMVDAAGGARASAWSTVWCRPATLMTEARTLAASLAGLAPVAMRYAIDAINRGTEMAFPEATFLEATLFGLLFSTDDAREGTRAFLEKRKAAFQGK